jgi:DNA repair exonuclease SbcCD nuclease subunit
MKIALLCDSHFGTRSDSKVFLEHQSRFFEEQFFPYLEQNEIDTIIHLGDIFDRRKYINFYTLKRTKEFFFDEMKKRNIEMHAILGNHDTFFTTTNDINSVALLLTEYDNIHIYEDEVTELDFGSTCFAMCPWLTKENTEKNLKALKNSKAHILCGHFDLKGFEMMKGVVSDHGLDHKTFDHFESVYSGHYHHQSQYGNVKYLGAQYEMNWSDYACKKGFHVIDTENRELTFIENDVRIYHKINYDDVDLTIDDIASLDTSALKDCYVKVVVKNRTNPYLYDLFLNRLNECGAADIKSVEDNLSLSESGVEEMLEDAKDTKDILHAYIDSVETTIEKSKIKKVVDQLYLEALNV